MAEKELIQVNNNKKEKKESILRHILKVKEELIELPVDLALTDRMDVGSSCETITLDDDFTPRNEENIAECRRETFSDDSLEDSGNSTEAIDVKNMGDAKHRRTNLAGSLTSTSLKVTGERPSKKPSMIPKLSRNSKLRENEKTNSIEQKYLHKNTPLDEPKKCQNIKTNVKITNLSSNNASNCQVDIPPMKITSLQQKLKATTSIIKQKMEYGNPKDGNNIGRSKARFTQSNSSSALTGHEKPQNTLGTLYRNIVQIRETALALSKSDNFKNHKGHIEKLFKTISEIQNIADKLAEIERKQDTFISKLNTVLVEKLAPSEEKLVQSKVRIFPKLNDKKKPFENPKKTLKCSQYPRSSNLKRKTEDLFGKFKEPSNCFKNKGFKKKKEDILDKCLSNIIESGELKSISGDDSKIFNDENSKNLEDIQNIDSMDGIFIPACEPPSITEDYYEIDGLENYTADLSLLEFKNLLYKSTSNNSLRIPDISTETMKTLKRCPKDFTLRMDFIQGKMLFQSTKTIANNVSFGPDLKVTEIGVDEKKSDVINIKPSTECSFASQLISVDSYKSLKTTDSEIFNAVNLPLVYSNKSRNALSIRSCGGFYKKDSWSVVFLTKQNVTSMPEITGPLEEAIVENIHGSDVFHIRQKRRKNRGKQSRNNIFFNDLYQEVN